MVHGDAEINMAGVDPRRFSDYAPGGYTKAKSHEEYEHMYKLHLPGEERPASPSSGIHLLITARNRGVAASGAKVSPLRRTSAT